MPLPWIMVFFLIFLFYYSVFLFFCLSSFSYPMGEKTSGFMFVTLPW